MAEQTWVSNFNIGGLNLYINPLLHGYLDQAMQFDGELIRAVNVDSFPLGAKTKRTGYSSFLDSGDATPVKTLFSWKQDNGSSTFLYKFQGSVLSYYDALAGSSSTWNPCVNGTFNGGSHIGYAILNNTMILGDGVNPTRHTTDGTTFTNTTLAPVGEFFATYQGANGDRVYIGGTSSNLFYSVSGDATNWSIAGTNDSSSFIVPDAGKIGRLFVLSSLLMIAKNSGQLFRWDGGNLFQVSTNLGPTSPYSYATIEGNGFWLNNLGIMTSQGDTPQVISNPVQRFIYNDDITGISPTIFGTAPGVIHKYDYLLSVGSVQDDFTNEPLNNGILKYNYQKNEFLTMQFADMPTAYTSYRDAAGQQQLLFGNATGQCFLMSGTAMTDNGQPIPAVMEMVFNFNTPYLDKDWRWFIGFFNPGCEAEISVALSDTFTRGKKSYIDLGDATSGVVKYKFPTGARSKLLYLRIRESSRTARFSFYGASISAMSVDPG